MQISRSRMKFLNVRSPYRTVKQILHLYDGDETDIRITAAYALILSARV